MDKEKELLEKPKPKLKTYLVHNHDLRNTDMKVWDKKMISISKASYEVVKLSELKKEIDRFENTKIRKGIFRDSYFGNFHKRDWLELKQRLGIE